MQRKSEESLRLSGHYRPDRHKGRGNPPVLGGEPVPLELLSKDAAEVWQELVPALIESGIVCRLDSLALTLLCDLITQYRFARRTQKETGWTAAGARAGAAANMLAKIINDMGKQFFMDPKARQNLLMPTTKPGYFVADDDDGFEREYNIGVPTRKRS